MDTISDREAKEIWQRVKRYINPENIKAGSREELAKEIEKQMSLAGSTGKAGSMDSLIRNGFADRISYSDEVKDNLIVPTTPEAKKEFFEKKQKQISTISSDELPNTPNIKLAKGNKISIRVRGRTRNYARKNIRITKSSCAGRSAYYVYNTRLKKRVTWGFA